LTDGYRIDKHSLVEFRELFEEFVKNNPEDKDGYLMLGLANFRTKEYDKAFSSFEKAKSFMADDELAVFANTGYLKIGGLKETAIQKPDSSYKKFWLQKDPLFLTEYNERELEHYSRVAEANLRFTDFISGVEGWQTEQGKILIKYGLPKNRVQVRPLSMDLELTGLPVETAEETERFKQFDFWGYDNFTFTFSKQYSAPDSKYQLSVWQGLNFNEIAEDVEKEFPDYYEYEPKGKLIDLAYSINSFRGEDGKTRIELNILESTNTAFLCSMRK
jgi:GWxTD domain-containing protein